MDINLENMDKSLFEFVPQEEKNKNIVVRPSETYWQDAWRRLRENKVATISLVVLILLAMISFVGPYLCKYDYRTNDMNALNLAPKF